MLYEKIREMNELGKLEVFNNYLLHIGKDIIYAKSKSTFENNGWYCVLDADGFEKYLVYHYDTGKKICVRFVDGKTPQIQEADPSLPWFGEIIDVFSVLSFASDSQGNVIDIVQNALDDEAIKVNHLNTEEGSAVKLIGYDTEGNLVEDDIPEGIVVDDALNTESDNAIANAPVAQAFVNVENGTIVAGKALSAKSIEAVSTESGAVQDTPFIYQGTGTANGTSIADTSPVGKHLEKQGNSVVVNQMVQNADFESASGWNGSSSTVLSISNGIATISKTSATANAEIYRGLPKLVVANHKYLVIIRAKTPSNRVGVVIDKDNWVSSFSASATITPNQWATLAMIITATSSPTSSNGIHIYPLAETEDDAQAEIDYCYIIDLTQWFSGNIPQDLLDHPENFFRYYNGSLAYNAGSMENGTGRYLTCGGRNVWDEEWEVGLYNVNTGAKDTGNYVRNKNPIRVTPNTDFYLYSGSAKKMRVLFYDVDGNFISSHADWLANQTIKIPANCAYVNFFMESTYGTTYKKDITISLYYTTGDSYDQYFPYEEPKVYDTGSEPLYGIEGSRDIKAPDGTITRKMDGGKLEDLEWQYSSELGFFYTQSLNATIKKGSPVYTRQVVICDKYSNNDAISSMTDANLVNNFADKSIQFHQGNSTSIAYLYLKDTSLNGDASLINGNFHYALAEPTTEQGTPFAENIEINDYGTMGWDSEVPQGCKIFYPADYALFIDSVGQRQDINWDALAIVSHTELNNETDALEAKDTQLLNALGGTLRQLLAVSKSIDFANTDFVDLGELSWARTNDSGHERFYVTLSGAETPSSNNEKANLVCTKYNLSSAGDIYNHVEDKTIGLTNDGSLVIYDSSYTDASAFKNAMKGVLLAYEKASE